MLWVRTCLDQVAGSTTGVLKELLREGLISHQLRIATISLQATNVVEKLLGYEEHLKEPFVCLIITALGLLIPGHPTA